MKKTDEIMNKINDYKKNNQKGFFRIVGGIALVLALGIFFLVYESPEERQKNEIIEAVSRLKKLERKNRTKAEETEYRELFKRVLEYGLELDTATEERKRIIEEAMKEIEKENMRK